MELTSEVMVGFVGSLLAARYDSPTTTPDFHLELWDYCCSSTKQVAIAAPRRHAKSTAITHAYLLASVLFRQSCFALLVSDTETQAINFLNDINKELKNNEHLISLFEIDSFKRDTETDIIVKFKDGKLFRILCRGAEQKVRGLKWEHLRPDLIIWDDGENDELVANKDRRDKLKRWFHAALIPCMSTTGKIRVIGTVLHEDSLLNSLLPDERKSTTLKTELKTYSTVLRNGWLSVKYRAHSEDLQKILWPEMYEADYFVTIKEQLLDQGLSEVYAQEWLNEPIDIENAFFRKEDITPMSEQEKDDLIQYPEKYHYYIGVDLAVSETSSADYTVFCVVAVDSKNIIYVIDIIRQRMDTLVIVDTFFDLCEAYNPEWFVYEKGGLEKAIKPLLQKEMISRNTFFELLNPSATKDKITRAKPIQQRMRVHALKVDTDSSWYGNYVDEFLKFPKGKHDDQVDALAWIGLTYNKVLPSQSDSERIEEEYDDMLHEEYENGQSKTTGY